VPYTTLFRSVPMEIAESVEILKGPSALLSGMAPGGNVAGAINIVPKRAGYAAHAGIGRLLVRFPIWHKYRHGAPLWHGWPVRDSRQRFISLRRYNDPQSKCPGRPVLGRAGLPRQARTRLAGRHSHEAAHRQRGASVRNF